MRRLAYAILGVLALTHLTHTANARAQGVDSLAKSDFTFAFDKEAKNNTFEALGGTDAVLNSHLNQARCLCDEKLRVRVTLSAAAMAKLGTETVTAQLVVGARCDDEDIECTALGSPVTFSRTMGSLEVPTGAAELFAAAAKDEVKPCEGVEGNLTFWVILEKDGTRATVVPSKALRLDSKPPEAPEIEEMSPSDGAASVKWKRPVAGTVSSYQVMCSPAAKETQGPAFTYCPNDPMQQSFAQLRFCSGKVASSSTKHKVLDLENGKEYGVKLLAMDASGNVSAFSEEQKVTPAPSRSFHDLYKEEKGQAEGGCHVSPGGKASQGLAFLIGIVLFGGVARLLRRHRMKATLLLALLACAVAPSSTRADVLGIIEPPPRHEIDALAHTERGFNLNLAAGFYRPDVDSEFGGDGPFAQAFGKDTDTLWQLRFERLLWQKVGTLSIGLGTGYYRATGTALLEDGRKSEDKTSLLVVPLTLDLGYQYDMWVRRGWGLMPFARAGIDRAFWFMRDQDSTEARGGTNGWHGALGLAFALDALDPESAQQLDSETGVNHTLIYAEYLVQDLSGFGSSKRLQLSDSMLSIGLSLQM